VLLARFGITNKKGTGAIGSVIELGAPRGFREPDGAPVFRGRWTKATIVGSSPSRQGPEDPGSLTLAQASYRWTASGDPSVDPDARKSPYAALFVIASALTGYRR